MSEVAKEEKQNRLHQAIPERDWKMLRWQLGLKEEGEASRESPSSPYDWRKVRGFRWGEGS